MHREGIVDSKVAWMRTNKKMLLIKSNEWIYTLERQKICTLDLEGEQKKCTNIFKSGGNILGQSASKR